MIRRLASLHWLQRSEVRQLRRYYQDAMTSCCSSRRTSFPSLGDTSDALVVFAPWRTSEPPRPGVVNPVSPPGCCRGSNRSSQVLGEPQLSVCTCSKPTPAGLFAPDQFSATAWPLNPQVQRLPRLGLSALNSMAFGLAVYASQCGLLQPHARLASGFWSRSTGRDFYPQGSDERFQSCRLHLILLSQALLGAMGATCASSEGRIGRP